MKNLSQEKNKKCILNQWVCILNKFQRKYDVKPFVSYFSIDFILYVTLHLDTVHTL